METIHFLSEKHIFLFLIQLFILLSLAKLFSALVQKWGWPALVGEIACGILIGPTFLGKIWPQLYTALFPADLIQQNMLETVSWFGVLFLLLVTGFEVRLSSVWKQGKTVTTIGMVGVLVPIIMGCFIFFFLPENCWGVNANRWTFTFFLATAAAISAIPVIARILHDLEILKSDMGLTILSAFVINDILGWLIFTLVLGFSSTQGSSDLNHTLRIFFEIVLFGVVCLTIGSKIVGKIAYSIKKSKLPQSSTILTFITCLGAFCGIITQWIGIHAIIGFFLAGIMAGNTDQISERSREIISQMVHAVFVPIFFISIGLKIDFVNNFDILLIFIFSFVAIVGKYIGAWFGGVLSKMPKQASITIGIAHIPGGAMEIIIGMLALELQLISHTVFVAIVFAALASSIIVGPLLSWSMKRKVALQVRKYLFRKAINTNLKGNTKWDAIEELCQNIAMHTSSLDFDTIQTAVFHREKVMGTSMDKGIAIPHARIDNLTEPLIAFGRSRLGIDWDARDGSLTRMVFLILTPKHDESLQVQILSAIAKFVSQPEMFEKLISENDAEQIYTLLSEGLT